MNTVSNQRYAIGEYLHLEEYLEDAFDLFHSINTPEHSEKDLEDIRKEYFELFQMEKFDQTMTKDALGRKSDAHKNHESYCLSIPGRRKASKLHRIGVVNEFVNEENFKKSLLGKPNHSGKRFEMYANIIDEASRKRCQLFVQPELSLPYDFIPDYLSLCAKTQMAMVSGVEHWKKGALIFNFVFTCLPLKVKGIYPDAIPILRLKNHYAPSEEDLIWDNGFVVPKPSTCHYHLFHWNNLYFTNYYCYELTDIRHRAIFQSKIDLLIAPELNRDTNYFNSIVESTAREVHCYFIQANTAQYGDSRLTKPAKTEMKNPMTVKGGTTMDNPYTMSLVEIDTKALREFQRLRLSGQAKKSILFKRTPPDFSHDNAEKRLRGEPFGNKIAEKDDD